MVVFALNDDSLDSISKTFTSGGTRNQIKTFKKLLSKAKNPP